MSGCLRPVRGFPYEHSSVVSNTFPLLNLAEVVLRRYLQATESAMRGRRNSLGPSGSTGPSRGFPLEVRQPQTPRGPLATGVSCLCSSPLQIRCPLVTRHFLLRCFPAGNEISNQGAAELARALRFNGALQKLYLGCEVAFRPRRALITSVFPSAPLLAPSGLS